jgi:hypothetical protein
MEKKNPELFSKAYLNDFSIIHSPKKSDYQYNSDVILKSNTIFYEP